LYQCNVTESMITGLQLYTVSLVLYHSQYRHEFTTPNCTINSYINFLTGTWDGNQ